MTHKEKRLAQISIDEILKGCLSWHDSITIEVDNIGASIRVWDKEHGNRKPVAVAYRKELSDALNDIENELKIEKLAV